MSSQRTALPLSYRGMEEDSKSVLLGFLRMMRYAYAYRGMVSCASRYADAYREAHIRLKTDRGIVPEKNQCSSAMI